MGKNTIKRIAQTAEHIARRQGYEHGRQECQKEIERLDVTVRQLLKGLKLCENYCTSQPVMSTRDLHRIISTLIRKVEGEVRS